MFLLWSKVICGSSSDSSPSILTFVFRFRFGQQEQQKRSFVGRILGIEKFRYDFDRSICTLTFGTMHCTVKQWKQFIRICILCCIELIYRMRMQIEIDNFGFTLLTIFLSVCFFLFFFYFSFFCLSFSRKLTKVEVARLNVFQMRRFRSFSNHKNQEDSESSYNS